MTSHDGINYVVMEYLEGKALGERLKRGPLPLGQTLRHGIEIADALDKAHRQRERLGPARGRSRHC